MSIHTHLQTNKGKKKIHDLPKIDPHTILTFSYTSGTTGTPKAAMVTHENFASLIAVFHFSPSLTIFPTDVYISYLPLPHLFDRLFLISLAFFGCDIYFYNGDLLKLA